MYRSPRSTSWAAQILSNSVVGSDTGSAPSQAGGDDGEELPLGLGGPVLEVMRQVGVEGHGVALLEVAGVAVAHEAHSPAQHHRGLAAPRLVARWVPRTSGGGAGGEGVDRDLGALPGQRRREHLVAVAGP